MVTFARGRWSGIPVFLAALLVCLLAGVTSWADPGYRWAGISSELLPVIFQDDFEPGETCASASTRDSDGDGLIDLNCVTHTASPDPSVIAPPLDPTVPADFGKAVEFLYTPVNPVQHGMLPGVVEKHRVSVLRGEVRDETGEPAEGVLVRVLDHPEYGYTFTRADGVFDIVVNGGGEVVLDYYKPGYLRIHRAAVAPWRDWEWVPDATLVPLDPVATTVLLGPHAPPQVIRSSVIEDESGVREAVLLAPGGLNAALQAYDGTLTSMNQLTVRATEYTVGEKGPSRMPSALPPNVAYTYAVEFSADEAIAANARSVEFDKPLGFYLDNFLEFPVGTTIPVGAYDARLASWLPSDNGRVVKVLSIDGGIATLDVDGSGIAADAATLAAMGIVNTERRQLAALYPAGKELWRTPVQHFTPWDCNWPYAPNPDDEPPPDQGDDDPDDPDIESDEPRSEDVDEDNEEECGSLIRCEEGSLTEAIPLAGTGMSLVYSSKRVAKPLEAQQQLRIRITPSVIPASLNKATLELVHLGMRYRMDYYAPFAPDTFFQQILGRGDAYGRPWTGAAPWKATLGYRYPLVYMDGDRSGFQRAWARFAASGNQTLARYRGEAAYIIQKTWDARVRNINGKVVPADWDATGLGFGAWSLSRHHVLDKDRWIIYRGDGTEQRINLPGDQRLSVSQTLIKQHGPNDLLNVSAIAFAPDGAVLALAAGPNSHDSDSCMLWRHDFQSGSQVLADLCAFPTRGPLKGTERRSGTLTVDARGHAYTIRGHVILEITPQGRIVTVFDGSQYGASCSPFDLVAWSDRVFFTCGTDVLALWRDGQVTHLAGGGTETGEGVHPADYDLGEPGSIAVGPDGTIHVYDARNWVLYRIRTDGVVEQSLAIHSDTRSQPGVAGDYAPYTNIKALAMGADGNLLIHVHGSPGQLYQLRQNGRFLLLAGSGDQGIDMLDEGQSLSLNLSLLAADIAVAPDGSIAFVSDPHAGGTGELRRSIIGVIASSFLLSFDGYGALGNTQGYRLISRSGSEEYHFDEAGHHLATYDTTTGALIIAFEYNAGGYVVAATDGYGNRTSFTRNAQSRVTEVVAPDGQRTVLEYDADGLLASVIDPIDREWRSTYVPSTGLLATFAKPRGHASNFTWLGGRLTSDLNAEGGGWMIGRTEWPNRDAYQSALISAEGRLNTYEVDKSATGRRKRTVRRAIGSGYDRWESNTSNTSNTYHQNGVNIQKNYKPDPRFGWNAPYASEVDTWIANAGTGSGSLYHSVRHTREATLVGNDPGSGVYDLDFTTSVNGREYRQTYDATSRTWQLRTPNNRTQTIKLDAHGRPVERSLPSLEPVHYRYDARGRLESITAGSGADERRIQIAYDANGWPYQIIDAENRHLLLEHDPIGRLETQTLPDGRDIGFRYDANSNLVGLTPPGRGEHGFTYDKIDRLITYTAPEAQPGEASATGYAYNLDNQLTGVQRPDARTVGLNYEASTGRLTQIQSTTQPARPVSVDGYGRWTQIGINGSGNHSVGALWTGPLMRRQYTVLPYGAFGDYRYVHYTYDTNLRLASIDARTNTGSAANQPATYQYDTDSLLTQLTFGGRTIAYTRHPGNGLLQSAATGPLSESWQYNGFAEPTGYSASYNNSPRLSFTYTRDKLGRITQVNETHPSGSRSTAYHYDLTGRLTSVTRNGTQIAEYAYDANSNRIRATYSGSLAAALTQCAPQTGPLTSEVDAQDRMTRYGTCTYAYGANGELEQKIDTATGDTTGYQYDEFGNLREVTLPDGREITYGIDGLNRRVVKRIDGVMVQSLLYKDQLNPIAELDANGNFISIFAYGEKSHVPSLLRKGNVTYKIVSDHLGSVRQVIDLTNGQVIQALDYDAWGNVLLDTNPGFQPFGYAGGLYDRDTGLVRFGARDYDPVIGRWTAKDPIGFNSGGHNFYDYLDSDPVNDIDVEGLRGRRAANAFNAYQKRRSLDGTNRGKSVAEIAREYRQEQLNEYVKPRNPDFHETLNQLPDLVLLSDPEVGWCGGFGHCWGTRMKCSCKSRETCPVGPEVGPPPEDNPDCFCYEEAVPVL